MPAAGLPASGTIVSVSPPWSPSSPSRGLAMSGASVHSAPSSGHSRLPPPSCVASQVGVYMAVLPAMSVFSKASPAPNTAPATWPSAVAWLFAIVQFLIVPVGSLPSHTPPPFEPDASFSAMVVLVMSTWQALIQMPPLKKAWLREMVLAVMVRASPSR